MTSITTDDALQCVPLDMLATMARAGRAEFNDALDMILRRSSPRLAGTLRCPAEDEHDPFLFSFFTSAGGGRQVTLEQLVARSVWDSDPTREIQAMTNADGVAFMPRVGYVNGLAPHSRVGVPASARTEPINYLKGSIESLDHYVPVLDQFFGDEASGIERTVASSSSDLRYALADALNTMEAVWPELYRALAPVLRRVVTFRSESMNSFATNAAPGVVFLNVCLGDTEAFFLEDLAHQGGHVLLASATYDQAAFFSEAPDSLVSGWTGNEEDGRTIYVGLHGLATEAFMSILLARCLHRHALPPELTNEARGRLSFIFGRFTSDLTTLGALPIYNSHGAFLIEHFKSAWTEINRLLGSEIAGYDMSNLDYNFSYRRFVERNGHGMDRSS